MPNQIQEGLLSQIHQLESQVKQFVANEVDHYRLQARLDKQLADHEIMLELGRKLQHAKTIEQIAEAVVEALVEGFNYEKTLFFYAHKNNHELRLISHEGFYTSDQRAKLELCLYHQDLSELIQQQSKLLVQIQMPRLEFGMQSRVVIFCRQASGDLLGLILLGNAEKKTPYHRPIDRQDEWIWEMVKRTVSLSLENYKDLAHERRQQQIAQNNLRLLNARLEQIITERTRELAESKEEYRKLFLEYRQRASLYRTLLDAAPDPIVVYGKQQKLVYINPSFSRVFGWTKDELSQQHDRFTTQPDNDPVQQHLTKGEAFSQLSTTRRTKKGNLLEVIVSGATYNDEYGELAGSIIHLRDVTQLRKLEEAINRSKKLESLGKLAGGIAHDFNNALATILMNVEMARCHMKSDLAPEANLDAIETSTKQAVTLTHQLLTFAKGGLPVLKPASIEHLIKESSRLALKGSACRCTQNLSSDLRQVDVDLGQMTQAITNIFANSKLSMPTGGTINVSARNITLNSPRRDQLNELPNGAYVCIAIQDSGCGIPKETLPNIFDPYFTTWKNHSGLGLTTSYSIVRNHHGVLAVESKVDVGTLSRIYLPVSQKQFGEVENPSEQKAAYKTPKRILIMDDEHLLRETLHEMLTFMGYKVSQAANGEQALELYREAMRNKAPFELVIMDLTIQGGLGGKDAIRKLLKIDPNVRAVVSSGYSNDPVLANFRHYGFVDVLLKPFDLNELNQVIGNALGLRKKINSASSTQQSSVHPKSPVLR